MNLFCSKRTHWAMAILASIWVLAGCGGPIPPISPTTPNNDAAVLGLEGPVQMVVLTEKSFTDTTIGTQYFHSENHFNKLHQQTFSKTKGYDGNTIERTYSYDSLNRKTEMVYAVLEKDVLEKELRIYNARGWLDELQRFNKAGKLIDKRYYEYHKDGKKKQRTHHIYNRTIDEERSTTEIVVDYGYDGKGRKVKETEAINGDLVSEVVFENGKEVERKKYGGERGELVSVKHTVYTDSTTMDSTWATVGGTTSRTFQKMDSLGRPVLERNEFPHFGGVTEILLTYNEQGDTETIREYYLGHIPSASESLLDMGTKSMSYDYDQFGNWTRKTTQKGGDTLKVSTRAITYWDSSVQ